MKSTEARHRSAKVSCRSASGCAAHDRPAHAVSCAHDRGVCTLLISSHAALQCLDVHALSPRAYRTLKNARRSMPPPNHVLRTRPWRHIWAALWNAAVAWPTYRNEQISEILRRRLFATIDGDAAAAAGAAFQEFYGELAQREVQLGVGQISLPR
jgi:hypothetical protein